MSDVLIGIYHAPHETCPESPQGTYRIAEIRDGPESARTSVARCDACGDEIVIGEDAAPSGEA